MAASKGARESGTERNPLRKVLFMLSVGLSLLCVYFCLDYQSGSGARMSGELIVGKVDTAYYGDSDSSVAGFFFEHFGVLSYFFCFAITYVGYFLLLKPVDIWRADFYKAGLRILGFNCVLIGAAGILSRFADLGTTGAGGLLGDMLNIFFDLFVPNILTVLTFGLVMVCGIAFMSGSTPFALFERVGELFFKVVPSGYEKAKKRTPITDNQNVSLDPALTGVGTVAALSSGAAMASEAHASDELSDLIPDEELEDIYEETQEQPHATAQDDQEFMVDEDGLASEYESDPDEIDTSKYDFSQSMSEGAQGGIEPVFGEDEMISEAGESSNLDHDFDSQEATPDFFAGVMSSLSHPQAQTDAALDNDNYESSAASANKYDANESDYLATSDEQEIEYTSNSYIGNELERADDAVQTESDYQAESDYTASDNYQTESNFADDASYQAKSSNADEAYQDNGAALQTADYDNGQSIQSDDAIYQEQSAVDYAQTTSDVENLDYAQQTSGDAATALASEDDLAADSEPADDDIMSADELATALDSEQSQYSQTQAQGLARFAASMTNDSAADTDYSADAIATAAAQATSAATLDATGTAASATATTAIGASGSAIAAAAPAVASALAASQGAAATASGAPASVSNAMSGLVSAVKGALAAGGDGKLKTDSVPEHEMTNEEREAMNESLRKVVLADVSKVKSSGDPYAIARDRMLAKEQAAHKSEEQTVAVSNTSSDASVAATDPSSAATDSSSTVSEDSAAALETSAVDTDSPYGYGTYAAKHGYDSDAKDVAENKDTTAKDAADESEAKAEDDEAVHTIVQRTDPKVFAAQLEAQKKAREEKERLEREKAEKEKLEAEKKAAAEAEAKAKADEEAAAAEALAEKQALDEAIAAEQEKQEDGPHYAGTYADDMDKAANAAKSKDDGPKYITPGVGGDEDEVPDDKEGPGTIIRDTRKEFEAAQAARAAAKAEQERLEKERLAKEAQEAEVVERKAKEEAEKAEQEANEKAEDQAQIALEDSTEPVSDAQRENDSNKADKGISTLITRTVPQPKVSADTLAPAVASSTAASAATDTVAAVNVAEHSDVFKALSSLASEIDSATADVKLSHVHEDDGSAQAKGESEVDVAAASPATAKKAPTSVNLGTDEVDSFEPEHAYDFGDGHEVGKVNVDLNTQAQDDDDFSEFVSGHVQKNNNASPNAAFNFSRFESKDTQDAKDSIFSEESTHEQDSLTHSHSSGDDNIISFNKVKSFEVGGLSSAFIPMPGEESAKVRHSLNDSSVNQQEAAQRAAEAAAWAAEEQRAAEAARLEAEKEAAARVVEEQRAAARAAQEQRATDTAAREAAETDAQELQADQEQQAAQEAARRAAYNHIPAHLPAFGEEQPIEDSAFGTNSYNQGAKRADITRGFNFNQFAQADDVEIEDSFGSSDSSDVFNHSAEDSLFGKFDLDEDESEHKAGFASESSGDASAHVGKSDLDDLNAFISSDDEDEEDDDYSESDDESEDEEDSSYEEQNNSKSTMQGMMQQNYQGMNNMAMQGMSTNGMPMQAMQGMNANGAMPNGQIMQLPNGQYVQVMPNGMMYPTNGQGMMPNMPPIGQMGVNPTGQYMQLPNGQFVPVMPNGMPMMLGAVNQMGMMPNNPMQQGMMYGHNMPMSQQGNGMQPVMQQEMTQSNMNGSAQHEAAVELGSYDAAQESSDVDEDDELADDATAPVSGVGVNGYHGNNMSEAGNAFMGAHNSSSSNLPSYMASVAQAPASPSFEDNGSKALCTVPRHPYDSWRPSLDLLARSGSKVEVNPEELEKTAERINEILASYGVKAQVADYLTGPVITRFDLELASGVKSSAISSIETELCRNLLVPNVRVVPIIDGSSYVGLEVPNQQRQFITLADMASSREFEETKAVLPMCLGASVVGNPVVKDMADSPHLLVAGTTGSGKSAGLNTMLISMLLKRSPAELRLILVDPKQLEFSIYKDLPHLITPVITDVAEKTPIALNWCVDEMERRFKLMSLLGVRKLSEYNDLVRQSAAQGRSIPDPLWTPEMGGHPVGLEPLPWIVVVVEEFADLMAQSGRKKDKEGTPESLIARLSAKSRAAGIHLILVTQTPRSEVVTGMIKANFPSRIAFTVQNRIDSTIVLDEKGAESLLGNGDMLYKFTGSSTATRAHGAFTSNDDVKAVVDAWREYAGAPEYLEDVIAVPEEVVEESADEKPQKLDEKFDKAVELVRELGKAPTVSDLQSCLSIGYPRAKKLLRQLVLEGIID